MQPTTPAAGSQPRRWSGRVSHDSHGRSSSSRRPRAVVVGTSPRNNATVPHPGEALRGALEATLRRWLLPHQSPATDAVDANDDSIEDPLPAPHDPLKAVLSDMLLAASTASGTPPIDAADSAARAILAIGQALPTGEGEDDGIRPSPLRRLITELCRAYIDPAVGATGFDPDEDDDDEGGGNGTAETGGAARNVVATAASHRHPAVPVAPSPYLWRLQSTGRLRQYQHLPPATAQLSPGNALQPHHPFVEFSEPPEALANVPSPTFGAIYQTPGARWQSPRFGAADPGASQASVMSMLHAAPPQHTRVAAVGQELDDGTVDVNQYVLLQPLGRGRQGEVFLAMDTERNVLRAMKIVRRPRIVKPQHHAADGPNAASFTQGSPLSAVRDRARQQLEREISIMKTCRHRNVVALYEVIDDPDHDVMYIAMQYVEHGPLATLHAGTGAVDKTIPPRLLAQYARQLCAGLQYLHKHGVIHRDIKPENILLGQDDQVYLADFGMADVFEDASADGSPQRAVRGTRGTIAFMAPELIDATASTSATGEAVDVWALGVTLYTLLYGQLPWDLGELEGRRDIMQQITDKAISFPDLAVPGSPASLSFTRSRRPSSSADGPGPGDDDYVMSVNTDNSTIDSPVGSLPRAHSSPVTRSTGWPQLLQGMLQRDPRQRLGLAAIRRRVIGIEQAFDAHGSERAPVAAAAAPGASAISLLRHRSGRCFTQALPSEPQR